MPEDPPSGLDTQRDKQKPHRTGEQFQPEHEVDQGADEVALEEKNPKKEGRTNIAINEPAADDRGKTPSRGQSIKDSGRSTPGG